MVSKPDSKECRRIADIITNSCNAYRIDHEIVFSRKEWDAVVKALNFCIESQEESGDNGPGELLVGTNGSRQVVIELPRDMTGHIVFSPDQSRNLAKVLMKKADEAEHKASY